MCVYIPILPRLLPTTYVLQMRSMEKRQYEIEQGLRDPSELLGGGKDKAEGGEEDGEESEAAVAAKKENLTKAAMAIAAKGLKSTDPLERMKAVRYMRSIPFHVKSTPPLRPTSILILVSLDFWSC